MPCFGPIANPDRYDVVKPKERPLTRRENFVQQFKTLAVVQIIPQIGPWITIAFGHVFTGRFA